MSFFFHKFYRSQMEKKWRLIEPLALATIVERHRLQAEAKAAAIAQAKTAIRR